MKAIQVRSPGADFELVNREIPEPGDDQVRIRVEACGVCHGDAIVIHGHFPGLQYPRVPGHEVVGIIDQRGANAPADLEIGQRVGVGWYGGPCLKCSACQHGNLNQCENMLVTGISFDGGYASHMVAPWRAFVHIPADLSPVEAAPLLCAGRTTFDALRSSGVRGGDLVAIVGIGGLGHLALQYANKFGCKTVAISRGRDKAELARQLGAHIYIDSETANPGDELRKLGGAKAILATVPNNKAISDVIGGLGNEGQLLLLAMQSEPIQVSPMALARGGRSIRGAMGSPGSNTLDDTLNFSVLCNVRPMIEVFPLEQAALAFEKMITAKVHFRSVLIPQ
jgi:D-arabinose 1-dehydrogenase-like Zn-dependent alcohol dehydrogenase